MAARGGGGGGGGVAGDEELGRVAEEEDVEVEEEGED